MHKTRFFTLNEYCKQTFGDKVYRLSLNGGMSCPNRDGTLSFGGCTFCSEGGSGDFAADYQISVSKQLNDAKSRIKAKTNCHHFIAYFQAYTNTYASLDHLRRIYSEALCESEVVALSIGTRCDCLSTEILDLIEELSQKEWTVETGTTKKPIWIELGLQTIHNETHATLNTHTTIERFDDAIKRLTERNIPVITHLILGLPGETKEMILDSVKHVASLPIAGIKLQLLHVLEGTQLGETYKASPFPVFELEEYCDFVVDCLELLPPDMVIHRITGDGPRNLLIAPHWSTDKKRVLNTIQKRFRERDTWQGRLYKK